MAPTVSIVLETENLAVAEQERLRDTLRALAQQDLPVEGLEVVLANGDVLHGDIVEGDGISVVIETSDFGRLRCRLTRLPEW